jgi:cell wall-associated NlpC family hydrolase
MLVWIILLILIILFVVALVVLIPICITPLETRTYKSWFIERNHLPESTVPSDQWYTRNWNEGWGPAAATYLPPPEGAPSLVTVARRYLGLPYRHHHIPGWDPSTTLTGKPNESRGLDCSNYTSWVYNYGYGLHFSSNIHQQAMMYTQYPNMERVDRPSPSTLPKFQPGDLLYFWRELPSSEREISHVAMFTTYHEKVPYIIDSHGIGVTEHPLTGSAHSWYERHFNHAIRIRL